MIDIVRTWWREHPRARWFYPVWVALTALAFISATVRDGSFFWGYVCLFVLLVFILRGNSPVYKPTLENRRWLKNIVTLLLALVTLTACIAPMDMLPLWNGEQPDHRNQYELMAENILEGRIHFDYGDEENLLKLENPYDPEERKEAKVYYHWDHAFYNGRYYMYFGVVPVITTFLPYRLITGESLTTFRATQLYTALTVAGIFLLFDMLTKRYFKKLPHCVVLALSMAFSVMSVWYAAAEPALYCTAITAALALEVWSLYFFFRGVYIEKKENKQILLAGIGALLGALAFGCRPTIALANILVLPMLIAFLKQRKFSWKLLIKLLFAALPYVIVAIGLMGYNYARFGNPFEFGQKYQLTVADQSQYSVALNGKSMLRVINGTLENFLTRKNIQLYFPYLTPGGVFFNFPILLLLAGIIKAAVRKEMNKNKMLWVVLGIFVTVFAITAMDILWTPYLLERYRMDIYFLLGIACFIIVGFWFNTCLPKQRMLLSTCLTVLSVITVITAFLLCVNRIGVYYPDEANEIGRNLNLLK